MHIQKISKIFFLIFLTSLIQANPIIRRNVKYPFPEMIGDMPYDLHIFIENLRSSSANQKSLLQLNRLILHGPPGNGKTTIAHKIAESINAIVFEQRGSTIVDKYQGSGAEKIEQLFSDAKQKYTDTQPVVIIIDEVDAIASKDNVGEVKVGSRRDHESAVQTLWTCIDDVKDIPNIIIILITNKFKDLHPTLKDRFRMNHVEISNPNNQARTELITGFISKFGIKLQNETVQGLVKKTESFSARSIEDFVRDMKKIAMTEKHEIVGTVIVNHALEKYKSSKKEDNSWTKKLKNISDPLYHLSIIVGTGVLFVRHSILFFNWLKDAKDEAGKKVNYIVTDPKVLQKIIAENPNIRIIYDTLANCAK